jgi:hypothetical protein
MRMKTKKIPLWIRLIFTTMFVAGCAQSIENVATPPLATPRFPTSLGTASPSFTPLPTGEPVATLIPIAAPTLSIEEAQAKLLQLLSNNGNCRLPCLWGITPGESSFHEAQAILVPLSSASEFTAFETGIGSTTPYFIEDGLKIYTTIDFATNRDNNIINSIAFNTEAHSLLAEGGYEEVFDSQFFGEKVGVYSLSYVLTEQGIPSAVLISTMGDHQPAGVRRDFICFSYTQIREFSFPTRQTGKTGVGMYSVVSRMRMSRWNSTHLVRAIPFLSF